VALCLLAYVAARRTGEGDAGAPVPASSVACDLSKTNSLVTEGDFDSLAELALLCKNGHTLVAQALLASGFSRPAAATRQKVARALGNVARNLLQDGGGPLVNRCIAALSELAMSDGNPLVRAHAVEALGVVGSAATKHAAVAGACVEALAEKAGVDHGHLGYLVRKKAARSLAAIASSQIGVDRGLAAQCVSLLSSVSLRDRDHIVRETATQLLGEVVITAIARHEESVAMQIVQAMTKLALSDAAVSVREIAVQVVGGVAISAKGARAGYGATCADALATRALDDEAFVIRLVAAEVLGTLAVRSMSDDARVAGWVSALTEKALTDRGPHGALVRRRAVELLANVARAAFGKVDSVARVCVSALVRLGLVDSAASVRVRAAEAAGALALAAPWRSW